VLEKKKCVVFYSYTGEWKDELEERLQTEDKLTLLALGRNRYKLLAYLHK
jgi:hypothetical protein